MGCQERRMRVFGAVLVVSALTAWGSTALAAQDISTTNQSHQISVGDSVQAVQKALETDAAPSPSSSATARNETALGIPARGVRVFFNESGTAIVIRLDSPFHGSIEGATIGASRNEVRDRLGEPFKTMKLGPVDGFLYKRAGTSLRCDFGPDNVVRTIFVTSGTVNLDESPVQARVDSKTTTTGGQVPPTRRTQMTPEEQRAQAHLFGAVIGGVAHQYDLCSSAGFLPKGQQSAEETAMAMLAKMAKTGDQSESISDARKGWNASQEAADRDKVSTITGERCAAVAKQWNKWMAMFADPTH
jgi:hypothetical protein